MEKTYVDLTPFFLFQKTREPLLSLRLVCLLVVSLLLLGGEGRTSAFSLRMRLDVLGLARALGAVAPDAGSIDDAGASHAGDIAAFASAWPQSGAVLALHPSR